jgi:CBS domain containing-hemolysin-like protein
VESASSIFWGLLIVLVLEPVLSALFGPLFVQLFPSSLLGTEVSTALATGLVLLIISYLLVVLSELVPKAITLQYIEQVALNTPNVPWW